MACGLPSDALAKLSAEKSRTLESWSARVKLERDKLVVD
jgi:hypothetical protein